MQKYQVLTEKLLQTNQNLLVENELKKLRTFNLTYFLGKSRLEEDGTQNHLVFQPINRYFKLIANTKYISSCKSKGLSDFSVDYDAIAVDDIVDIHNYFMKKMS